MTTLASDRWPSLVFGLGVVLSGLWTIFLAYQCVMLLKWAVVG